MTRANHAKVVKSHQHRYLSTLVCNVACYVERIVYFPSFILLSTEQCESARAGFLHKLEKKRKLMRGYSLVCRGKERSASLCWYALLREPQRKKNEKHNQPLFTHHFYQERVKNKVSKEVKVEAVYSSFGLEKSELVQQSSFFPSESQERI